MPAQDMADCVGVSASTIRDRIDQLEADCIISGYHPGIDYEAVTLPLQVSFVIFPLIEIQISREF